MSDKFMDTSTGGEQTQYESVHTFVEPHAKEAGQLGGSSAPSTSSTSKGATDEPNTQGITKADKIRYGQSIQEGGVGGKTGLEGGLVGGGEGESASTATASDLDPEHVRNVQGYGGGKDASREVGA